MADELAGLPQNIAPWFPPTDFGIKPPLQLPLPAMQPEQQPQPSIQDGPFDNLRNEAANQPVLDVYNRAMGIGAGDPFERAASRLRAPYAQANARVSGLPDVATLLANRVANVATAPRDALAGTLQVTDPETGMPTPEAIRRAQQFAGSAMTGAMPFAERGAAGIFGGRLAQGANVAELSNAKSLAQQGAHPDDIWNMTGWFQGADRQWRHEIPDTLARINPEPSASEGKLPAVLTDHPLLYAAYPELKNANYNITPGNGASYSGRNAAGEHVFDFGDRELKFSPSSVLHEIQHAVQRMEGFSKGGMPQQGPYPSPFEAEIAPLMRERIGMLKNWNEKTATPEDIARLEYLDKVGATYGRLQRAYGSEAFRNYERLAGEVEARNVQSRFGPGAATGHPQQSESIPRSEQIVSPTTLATGPRAARSALRSGMTIDELSRGFDPFRR